MYAIISDRGRQVTVREGEVLQCDLNSDWKPDQTITFDRVLLVGGEGQATVGTPVVKGARVTGVVLGEVKGEKLVVFRFKRRKGVRRKRGHRQTFSRVRITSIAGG